MVNLRPARKLQPIADAGDEVCPDGCGLTECECEGLHARLVAGAVELLMRPSGVTLEPRVWTQGGVSFESALFTLTNPRAFGFTAHIIASVAPCHSGAVRYQVALNLPKRLLTVSTSQYAACPYCCLSGFGATRT
jgi:hypothetical protein